MYLSFGLPLLVFLGLFGRDLGEFGILGLDGVNGLLHGVDVLLGQVPGVVELEPVLDLLLELLTKELGGGLAEAVDSGGDGALVGQVAGNAALVLGSGASDERRVEDQTVLGSVACVKIEKKLDLHILPGFFLDNIKNSVRYFL